MAEGWFSSGRTPWSWAPRVAGATAQGASHRLFTEHGRVRLKGRLDAPEGVLPTGSEGTVIHCYADDRTYEVEFVRPVHVVATLRWNEIERM